ncbi:unnamed protein product, partial [Meganyctiphanes norvegica]
MRTYFSPLVMALFDTSFPSGTLINFANEKIYTCSQCDKTFSNKDKLKSHKRTHEEKRFKCKHCGKAFARNSYLILHLRIHTGERPFQCKLCDKSFSVKHHLEHHMHRHT